MDKLVTKLSFQKKNRERVNVFINDKYAFSLNVEIAKEIKKGELLTENKIAKLQNSDLFFRAYEDALKYISLRVRSTYEVKKYLKGKNYNDDIVDEVLENRLKKYLNDEVYAKLFIENRERFNPKSSYALAYELRNKGINEAIIDSALKNFNNKDSALSVIKKNKFRFKNKKGSELKKKVFVFLQGKGFDFETIYDVWRDIQN